MLVLAASPQDSDLRWRGRRHDDDGSGAVAGSTVADLFDVVFHALHDGEQVAVGFPAPLGVAAVAGEDVVATASRDQPAVRELAALLAEIGKWRPWTVLSTSLPRWRATTSVLVWETTASDTDAAVEAFFALIGSGSDHGVEDESGAAMVNVAAALALEGGLTVDQGQLDEPVVRVSAGRPMNHSAPRSATVS